jgi:hypothetical protein
VGFFDIFRKKDKKPVKDLAPPSQVPRAQLVAAARAVFNNSFSQMVFDPEDKLWKEPIQKELNLLVKGGAESVSVIEELLTRCANGKGGTISDEWWYGGKWAVKAVALLPKKKAAALMVRLLQKDSNIAEWFNHVQSEAAKQLGAIGSKDLLPALQGILAHPLSMSPVNEIANAVEKIGGSVEETPSVILAKAQNRLGDQDGIEYLLKFMERTKSWGQKDAGFYWYLLGYKSQRLGHIPASRAFFAAQVAVRPDSTTYGWQEFMKEGIKASPETALRLHGQYPVPKTMEEIKSYAAPSLS